MGWKRRAQVGIEYLNRSQRRQQAHRRQFHLEPLESRVLPSGISPFPVKKASFLDADGDKVTISSKGNLVQISLLGGGTNNADVNTITIQPGKLGVYDPSATLTIKVKQGKFGGGDTEINQITMLDLAGTERLNGLQLANVFVNNINLPGHLGTLAATNSDFGNVTIAGTLTSMVIGERNLTGTISAQSIGTITNTGPLIAGDLAGNILSATTITKILTNRITGSITAGGAIGTLATVEDLDGSVVAHGGTLNAVIGKNLDGALIVHNGNINLGTLSLARVGGHVSGVVQADGTVSLHAKGDLQAGATILAGGNLVAKANRIETDLTSTLGDVTFVMKEGGLTTAISAGDDVFGDGPNGAIVIRGGNLSGQISAGGDIADIQLIPNTLGITGSLTAGGNIGKLTAHFFSGANVSAVGNVGDILVEHKDDAGGVTSAVLNSTFSAGGNLGTITVRQTGGDAAIKQSAFNAGGSIGAIRAETTGSGSAIEGVAPLPTFQSGGSIGNLVASAVTASAVRNASFNAGTSFGNLTASASSGDGFENSSFIASNGNIGDITGSSSTGRGMDNATFQAQSSIGVIRGTSGSDSGIYQSTFRAVSGSIASITGRSTGALSTADAIRESNFTAGGAMGAILGEAQLGSGIAASKFSAEGNITSIEGSTANTNPLVNKDGIQNSVFRTHGSIAKILGRTAVADGREAMFTDSEAIDGSVFSAYLDILTASGASIEAIGDIQNSTFLAGYDIGGNLIIDGLAGPGSDDIQGDPTRVVQIGDITTTSDIVASRFFSGVGSDDARFEVHPDNILIAPGSSIGNVTVAGVIAGDADAAVSISSDRIGLISADAIGMSDSDPTVGAPVGIVTSFFPAASGDILGILVSTNTRAQAISDETYVTLRGALPFVTVTNLSSSAQSGIGEAFFGAGFGVSNRWIGDVTVTVPNNPGVAVAIDGAMFLCRGVNPDTDLSLGNIRATVSNVPGSTAIRSGNFHPNGNMGDVTAIGNIEASVFGTQAAATVIAKDVANVPGGTGITVYGNIVGSLFEATEGALGTHGGIKVFPLEGEGGYISNTRFAAFENDATTSLAIGNFVVQGRNEDGAAMTGVSISADPTGNLDIGSFRLTAGSLENSTIEAGGDIAMKGGIFIYGNSVHKDFAIFNSGFIAGTNESLQQGDIGWIELGPSGLAKDTVGTQIGNAVFSAWNIASGIDDMGTSSTADDVVRSIIIHGNNTGSATNRSPAGAGLSIHNSVFAAAHPTGTANIGSIGSILIAQSPGDVSGGGIHNSRFEAGQSLGDVRVRMHVTDAEEDVSAIRDSIFRGESVSADGRTEFGFIGNIVAQILGTPSTQDVIANSTFLAGPDKPTGSAFSLGNITATTQGSGAAVSNSAFRAHGDVGTVTLRSGSSANNAVIESVISAFGSIGSGIGNDVDVVGNVRDSKFLAGYDIGRDLVFNGFPVLSNASGVVPTQEQVNVAAVKINRVSINGNLVASDIIAGINPGDDIFGNTAPLALDANGNPLPPLPGDDSVAAEGSFLGTVQVQGGAFFQGTDQKMHAVSAGFIALFQQPSNITRNDQLPGFLNNPAGSGGVGDPDDVRISGSPSGAPVFLTSRDFAGREIDFNFDGNPDVILLDSRANQLKIFLGTGTGAFSDPQVFFVGTAPVAAVVGNFNGDHRLNPDGSTYFDPATGDRVPVLDIIVLNSLSDTRAGVAGANTLDIFLGDPVTGAFTEARRTIQNLGFGARTLTSMVASDWVDTTASNAPVGDGFLDLVITNATNNHARLLRNDGNAVFTSTLINNPFATGAGPTGASATPPLSVIPPESSQPVAADYNIPPGADLDGANGPDLVVANAGAGTISVYGGNSAGNGNGQFGAPLTLVVGTTPLQTILADVDDDGDVDILTVNFGSDNVTVHFNNGTGLFPTSATVALAAGSQPRAIIVGFFDGDNFIDFATANAGSDSVSVVLNTDGVFAAPTITTVALTGAALSITSADYDNDGDVDLAVTNAALAQAPVVLRNNGSGTFA